MNSIVRDVALAPELAADDFRQAMRVLAGGVSIVAAGYGSEISGMTVTSLTSLSAEPPRVMVGVNRAASVFPLIERFGAFGVSILAADQKAIADRFSTKAIKGAMRFEGLSWQTRRSGAPLLSDSSAVIDCQVEEIIERHSHAIVIGRVLDAAVGEERGGLAYREGKFYSLDGALSAENKAVPWGLW